MLKFSKIKNFLFFNILFLFFYSEKIYATTSNQKIVVTAQSIHVYKNKNIIKLIKNASIKQNDTELKAEEVVIYMNDNQSIKEIYFEKNIVLTDKEFTATGNKGYYYPDIGVIKVFESITVYKKGYKVYGEKFIYNLNSEEGRLVGNKKEKTKIIIDNNKL